MSMNDRAIQSIPAFPAEQFQVEIGANMGDGLSVLDELVLDDIYQLAPTATAKRLGLVSGTDGQFYVAQDTELGTVGAQLHLDSAVTLMPQSGDNVEALVMVEVDPEGLIAAIYLVPMMPMEVAQPYTLVRAEQDSARPTRIHVRTTDLSSELHNSLKNISKQTPSGDDKIYIATPNNVNAMSTLLNISSLSCRLALILN